MSREYWRPSNMLYPVPPVIVTCREENGRANAMTAAWAGTVCSDPVMVSVSIRPSRYSHDIIERTGEFAVNLPTRRLARVTDFLGVLSGRDIDKFDLPRALSEGKTPAARKFSHLTKDQLSELMITESPSRMIKAPGIAESPVNLECRVHDILRLGSHDLFLGEVVSTDIDSAYLDERGRFDLAAADLITYSHGEYYALGELLGKFGWSVRKPT